MMKNDRKNMDNHRYSLYICYTIMAGCALNKSHLETETRGQSAIAPGAMFDEWAFFLTPR